MNLNDETQVASRDRLKNDNRSSPTRPSKGTASAFNSRGFLNQPLSDTRYTWQTKYRTMKNTEYTFGTGEYTFTLLGNPWTERM